jgi:hypothetical protein
VPSATSPASALAKPITLPEAVLAVFTLEEVDELGYVSSRKLHMGCEAALCRTPFGASIVVLRSLRLFLRRHCFSSFLI